VLDPSISRTVSVPPVGGGATVLVTVVVLGVVEFATATPV